MHLASLPLHLPRSGRVYWDRGREHKPFDWSVDDIVHVIQIFQARHDVAGTDGAIAFAHAIGVGRQRRGREVGLFQAKPAILHCCSRNVNAT